MPLDVKRNADSTFFAIDATTAMSKQLTYVYLPNMLFTTHKSLCLSLIAVCCMFLLNGCSTTDRYAPMRIACAANLAPAMEAISEAFESKTGNQTEVVIASSGKLAAQIREGAPYNVFITADEAYADALINSLNLSSTPVEVARGRLVLWSRFDKDLVAEALDMKHVKHFAIANPDVAPFGKAGMAYLESRTNYKEVKSMLILGESIGQTNQFLTSGAANMGITAKSSVLSPAFNIEGYWYEIPQSSYSPIRQCALIIPQSEEIDVVSKQFVEYLLSTEAQKILAAFGSELDELN